MKGLALPPYYMLVHSLGKYEKEVEILKQINEELKTKIRLYNLIFVFSSSFICFSISTSFSYLPKE